MNPAAEPGSILQLKVRLLETSPMVWRRILVPESASLRELHGMVQVAMGWTGIHLFEFTIRGVRYTGPVGDRGSRADEARTTDEMNGQSFRLNHSRARNKGSTT